LIVLDVLADQRSPTYRSRRRFGRDTNPYEENQCEELEPA